MPLSEIYLDMLKKRQDTATKTAEVAAPAKVARNLFGHVFSPSENEFEELEWDKGHLVVSRKSFAACSPSSNDGVSAGEQVVVPWIRYPVSDDLLTTIGNKALIPAEVDDCVDLLNQLTGFDNPQDRGHEHKSIASPVLFERSKYNSEMGKKTNFHFRESSAEGNKGQDLKTVDFMDAKQKNQEKDSVQQLLNFSHFLRPAMLSNNASTQGACKLKTNEAKTTASNVMECPISIKSTENDSRTDSAPSDKVCRDEPIAKRKEIDQCSSKVPDKSPDLTAGASSVPRTYETVKGPEMGITSSTKCSANQADASTSDPKDRKKRRVTREGRHRSYESEDEQGDSEDTKEPASGRRMSLKRKRAAEVHNLSERRRRDRINEKMHELQELIPHCNKVDKVSMLEQAIEYLKMLKMQVQMMSMGSGMYMAPMMFSPAMQPAQMPPFSPMPMGMGFGMGMFSNNSSPIMSIPAMPGPQFRGNFFPGSGGQQIDSTTELRMPVLVPRPTPFALFPGHSAMPTIPPITNPEQLADHHKKNMKDESPNKRNTNS